MGEMMGFESFPVALDVVEFGRIFWQPFGREPVRALGQRGARGLAGVNRAVIENNRGRLARCRRFGAIDFIKPLQQGDDIGAAW